MGILVYFTENLEIKDSVKKNKSRKHSWSTRDIDLPGYKKEDVNIELDKGYLTISAKHEVSDEEKDSKGNIIRQERSFGSCSRSFYVGDQIKPETISAKFENGVLKLNVPYEQPKPQVTNTKIMID